MKMQSNTILITGGGSGIGRGLAEAFHRLGNQVIVTGRREELLREVCAANPGMRQARLDVADRASITELAEVARRDFPALNCVINNAGVQSRNYRFTGEARFDDESMTREIQTNLAGLIRMCAAFVPLLQGKAGATVINVSSGLAFVPIAWLPVYCATKAAVHSFTLSLRRQLRDAGVRVIELVPPYVKTDLGGPRQADAPSPVPPMPLDVYIAAAMEGLAGEGDEVLAGDAAWLARAGGIDTAKQAFSRLNG